MGATAAPGCGREPGCAETVRKLALGRGVRNVEAGFDRRAASDDAADVSVFHGAKTLRPHRGAGANEVVQRRDERGEARAGGGIAIETAENELIEARRYGAPMIARAGRLLPDLRMRIVWS